MKTVSVKKTIPVAEKRVWEVVRTGADMDRWVPAITHCELDGQGAGANRLCIVDGRTLRETVETVDDQTHLFQYRIHEQSLLPVRNVVGSIHVAACGDNACTVLWFANLELDDESAWPAVREALEALYVSGIDELAAILG